MLSLFLGLTMCIRYNGYVIQIRANKFKILIFSWKESSVFLNRILNPINVYSIVCITSRFDMY